VHIDWFQELILAKGHVVCMCEGGSLGRGEVEYVGGVSSPML